MPPFVKYALILAMVYAVPFSSAHSQQQRKTDSAPRVIPPATEEMQHPEYWISRCKNPDAVFLTPAQIVELNRKNQTRPYECKDVNGNPFSFLPTIIAKDNALGLQFHLEDPLTLRSFPGDSLRARLNNHNKSFNFANLYDRRQVKWDPDQVKEVMTRVNAAAVQNVITPRYGILVGHTLNRAFPTNEAVYWGPTGWLDSIQSTALDMCMPVAVLHASPDGDWFYVRSELAFGWIPASHVALGSPKAIGDYGSSKDFLVAIAHKVPIFSDRGFKNHLSDFYLGARIKLVKKTAAGYQVIVPFRQADGSLKFVNAWVRPEAKVNVGYQAYTQRNILNTIFGLLYRPYGWADEHYERDCCGTQRAVLRTFGILTGRWTTMELHSSDHVYAFDKKTTPKEVKYKVLDTCEPAVTLMGDPGHIIMYLGKVDGNYFVIHQSGYNYPDKDDINRIVSRVNVNDTELPGGSNVKDWSEITEFRP